MSEELSRLDATAQAELVRKGEATPLELVDAAIARIEKINPELNAVIIPLFEKARREADSPDLPPGPFRGVPFLLKDLHCPCAGDPMHEGMKLLKDRQWVATEDNYLVGKFRAAGLVFVGRANTPELGLTITTEPVSYGPSRNPWNTGHSTGGSSGGSAAAVASGMVPAAHASDGGGSVRIPASECGLVGLKPSRGRVTQGPDRGDGWHGFSIDNTVTRSVRDTAAILDAIAGPMPGDPYAAPPLRRALLDEVGANPGRLRVGFLAGKPPGAGELHPDCAAAVREVAHLLESLGHDVEESYPNTLQDVEGTRQSFLTVVSSWTAAEIDAWGERTGTEVGPEDVEPGTWGLVEGGRAVSARQYIAARNWINGFTRRMASWWTDGFDLFLTPTIGEPPPALGELTPDPENPLAMADRLFSLMPFTPPLNMTGQPAISLPLVWNSAGLPIGVQLIAAYGGEDLLIQIASQLEEARSWKDRRPPVCA
jgi:amidase